MILPVKTNLLILLSAIMLTSCFSEDEVVTPQKPGDVETVVIEMLPEYTLQTWYSFEEGILSVNERNVWDLAMSTRPGDYTLWLNTSLFMYAAHTGIYDFETPVQTQGREWIFDESTGREGGNAIGRWWEESGKQYRANNEVILIDRGVDDDGISRGFLKIQPQIDPLTGEVTIRIAKPDGSDKREFAFPRDETRRFVTLSFDRGYSDPQIEPPADKWELLFTTYTTTLFTDIGEPYPYLVNGVLLNDTVVMAAPDTTRPFAQIDRAYAETLWLKHERDAIGYDWKDVNGDVTSGNITYTVDSEKVYIVRNRQGYLYKMRFIDFYNNQGKKGYPTFEFQRL